VSGEVTGRDHSELTPAGALGGSVAVRLAA
jgi:hypothetical protein